MPHAKLVIQKQITTAIKKITFRLCWYLFFLYFQFIYYLFVCSEFVYSCRLKCRRSNVCAKYEMKHSGRKEGNETWFELDPLSFTAWCGESNLCRNVTINCLFLAVGVYLISVCISIYSSKIYILVWLYIHFIFFFALDEDTRNIGKVKLWLKRFRVWI